MGLREALPTAAFSLQGIRYASERSGSFEQRLVSETPALDQYLGGGLSFGSVSEWGIPLGRGGREVIRTFIASATRGTHLNSPPLSLWISAPSSAAWIYPPAWAANGVDLTRIRFGTCEKPVSELKPIFLSPLFKVVVLDAPRIFSNDDLAFVARQARRNNQAVILLRNYFLSPDRGNVWAKFRVNCWRDVTSTKYIVTSIRGLASPSLKFSLRKRSEHASISL